MEKYKDEELIYIQLDRFERCRWLLENKPELVKESIRQDSFSSMIGDKKHHSDWLDKQGIPTQVLKGENWKKLTEEQARERYFELSGWNDIKKIYERKI